eukprot:GHVS01027135.1.p1 GENE.GHVS01027135.1~~GHVS01027135.1.p1  ORF type:complete len:1150 (+),score=123.45 GHVS01027135.1:50-3451(+)
MASAEGPRSRRDHLINGEEQVHSLWELRKVNEQDAGSQGEEKFFITFPYPYMNGRLHLGHAFSLSKAEFQARFQRMLGKKVLWPFAFHCTGMPIPACADKLRRELDPAQSVKRVDEVEEEAGPTDVEHFKSKRSKAVAKTGESKSQFSIMQSMGVPDEEIPKFTEPAYWLDYFPPLAIQDLRRFGVATDWRRSFITTNANPFYDAFIRWHFNVLNRMGKIKFGIRPTIISPIEWQPCADHDRASGEGAGPQEYTLIKLKVQAVPDSWPVGNRDVCLIAATLRPETMYGQTNCFVLPEGKYGLFLGFQHPRLSTFGDSGVLENRMDEATALMESTIVYVCSARCAENMLFQGLIPMSLDGRPYELKSVSGISLIGLPLSAPNAAYKTVYALPMTTIAMDKGSGVVTSVPSDAPDDYAALMDMKNKPAYFLEHFGVKQEWVQPFNVVEIIDVPDFGRQSAVEACARHKIKSQKDTVALQRAKEEVYKKGFYEGVMLVGSQKGHNVSLAKPIVREELLLSGDALLYHEPEKRVVSRSGADCVVALCNQWYIEYGEESWRRAVEAHVKGGAFRTFSVRTMHQFEHVLTWLREWACSRHYGLGTYLPWEMDKGNKVLIESLSDSTIYMAYYTIAHLLQNGIVDGAQGGPLGVRVEQLTDEVFDYIFTLTDKPPNSTIPLEAMQRMRSEFCFWYPMDMRTSGKDLIFNHLTMSLYNHAAVWKDNPSMWPRAMYCNGHVMVDAEKMSKSAGNFLTVEQAIKEYGSDATRLALADAGDSLDDANFQRETANVAIMRLFLLEQFIKDMCVAADAVKQPIWKGNRCGTKTGPGEAMKLRIGETSRLSVDDMFENEIIGLVDKGRTAYADMMFRDALKAVFFDFQTKRDQYKVICGAADMHRDSVKLYIDAGLLILSPICPHICERIWTSILGYDGLIVTQRWPTFHRELNRTEVNSEGGERPELRRFDALLHRQFSGLMTAIEDFRKVKDKAKGGKKAGETGLHASTTAVVYVAKDYKEWQQTVLKILQGITLNDKLEPPADFMNIVKDNPEVQKFDKNTKKLAMSFASYQMKEEIPARGLTALDLRLPFDEQSLLSGQKEFICRSLELDDVHVMDAAGEPHSVDTTANRTQALPGKPSLFLC